MMEEVRVFQPHPVASSAAGAYLDDFSVSSLHNAWRESSVVSTQDTKRRPFSLNTDDFSLLVSNFDGIVQRDSEIQDIPLLGFLNTSPSTAFKYNYRNSSYYTFKYIPFRESPSASILESDSSTLQFSHPMQSEVDEIAALRDGWDGEGTIAPTKEAIHAAREFLSSTNQNQMQPEVSAGQDGEVNVSWRTEKFFLDLSFYSAGGASMYARLDDEIFKNRGIKIISDLPSKILTYLSWA